MSPEKGDAARFDAFDRAGSKRAASPFSGVRKYWNILRVSLIERMAYRADFFLATFLTSIPAYFIGYAKMLDTPSLITGNGANPSMGISTGAALEVLLIVANVATAVIAYPVLKRESEMGAIGYVAARLCEAMFIAIGIVARFKFNTHACLSGYDGQFVLV